MNKEEGGPAFPTTLDQVNGFRDGMTLRDYFAAKVMQAEIASGIHEDAMKIYARRAYKMADAMLEARK